MPTVLELIDKVDKFFSEKGIESPRLNAELLLAEVLSCKRLNLYLQFDRPLKSQEVNLYREMVRRRSLREPLQYIIGKVEFFGLEFKVNKNALIPRPETELLVEEVLKSYKSEDQNVIIEVGTGSGNICGALASKLTGASIYSIDNSLVAVELAHENMQTLKLNNNVKIIHHDIFSKETDNLPQANAIVSNPPYVSQLEFETLQEEIVKYEPRTAVTDEGDGYRFYERIAKFSADKLLPGGKLFFELGFNSAESVQLIMENYNFSAINIVKDYNSIPRVISGVK